MSYVAKNLLPSETIVYQTRLHWFLYLRPLLILAIGIGLCVPAANDPDLRILLLAGGAIVLLGLFDFLLRWIFRSSSEFAVTDHRVLIKVGFIRRTTLEVLIRKIESIEVEQGLLGRIFGFGTIIVIGTGGTTEPFSRIAHPLEFRRQVQAQAILER